MPSPRHQWGGCLASGGLTPLFPAGAASRKMHYYRYSSAEVSCWYKYLLFSYNIVFWVSGPGAASPAASVL